MPILAEGASGTAFDTGIANQFLANAGATITSFWTSNQTVILSIIGIVVTLSLVWLGIKLWKRATGKA